MRSSVTIQRDVIALLLSHALKESRTSGNEVIGWLLGFLWNGEIYVCDAVPCTRYKKQTKFSAEADPVEEAELASKYPRNVGIVGLYHSHPFSLGRNSSLFRDLFDVGDIFHSHTDDHTMKSRAGRRKNYLSIVTNGIDYACFVMRNRVDKISPRIVDSISYLDAMDAYQADVEISFERAMDRRSLPNLMTELGRELTEHIDSTIDVDSLRLRNIPKKRRRSDSLLPALGGKENVFRTAEDDGKIRAEVHIKLNPVIYTSSKEEAEIQKALRNEIIDDSACLVWKLLSSETLDKLKGSVKTVEIGLGSFEIEEDGPLPQKVYCAPERSVARKKS
jgi:proteasome lid subunit RPN8/RPN11